MQEKSGNPNLSSKATQLLSWKGCVLLEMEEKWFFKHPGWFYQSFSWSHRMKSWYHFDLRAKLDIISCIQICQKKFLKIKLAASRLSLKRHKLPRKLMTRDIGNKIFYPSWPCLNPSVWPNTKYNKKKIMDKNLNIAIQVSVKGN